MNYRMIGAVLASLALAAGTMGMGATALETPGLPEIAAQSAQVQSGLSAQSTSAESAASAPARTAPVPAAAPSLEKTAVRLPEERQGETPLLVNAWNPLPADYEVELETLAGGYQIAAVARPALEQMLADCGAAGLDVTVCSAYRTESTQNRLYQNKIARLLSAGYSREEALAEAGRWVAPPGTSEHQTGLAVDIMATDYPVLDEKQSRTEEQQWLMEHCWEYGFILRYPTDKSSVTGIGYEPWHYRYVGEEVAADIHARGICLEEYLAVPAVEGASGRLQAAVDAALSPGGGWQLPAVKSDTGSKSGT